MDFKIKIFLAFLASILFHIILIGSLFYFEVQSDKETKWSGGRGNGYSEVTYVDLGKFEVKTSDNLPSTVHSPQSTVQDSKSKKLKLRDKKKSKSKKKDKSKIGQKFSGTGDSDTPAGGVGSGLDPDGVISKTAPNTLALIRKKIMGKKNYPLLAKDNQWTGSVKVSFKINEAGNLDFVKIIKGSGHKILDEAAVKTIKKASPLPFYPKVIALSLEYRLE